MENKKIKKKYTSSDTCAYPYLYEETNIVDFEIIMDEIASLIAITHNYINNEILKNEFEWLCELAWHFGGSIRGKNCITEQVFLKIKEIYNKYNGLLQDVYRQRFTKLIGSLPATYCELIRNKFKSSVRMLFLVEKTIKKEIPQIIFDSLNLLSNLFYVISLFIRVENKEKIDTYHSGSFKINLNFKV